MLVNGIVFVSQHFSFDFNLESKTVALYLNSLR